MTALVEISSGQGNPLLENHSRLTFNREVFLANYRFALDAFTRIDEHFAHLGSILSTQRDQTGHSHVSLIPFILVMQRQVYAAFELISTYQSFQAWVLMRPCLESALIMGKWIDDPDFARVWQERRQDFEAYRRAYFGRGLESKSLPRSPEIRAVLSRINDDFMHTNDSYYKRHIEVQPAVPRSLHLLVHHFDHDPLNHRAHLLAMINLLLTLQQDLLTMLTRLFALKPEIDIGLDAWQKWAQPRAEELVKAADHNRLVLSELGLWTFGGHGDPAQGKGTR